MYRLLEEGDVKIYSPKDEKISKSLPVFYNPEMKLGRDVALYVISKLKPSAICDAMAGTGVRALRILKETQAMNVTANDTNPLAIKLMKKNAKVNKLKLKIKNKDLNILLREHNFDYIDIDPFGSPAYYMDSAISSINNNGILAVTATDLGCLYGKYISACRRKYTSTPMNISIKRELGLRILMQKIQTMASKYDKALYPILSHATSHYIRVYFRCSSSRSLTNKILRNIGTIQYSTQGFKLGEGEKTIGPIWKGHLYDERLCKDFDLIKHIKEESTIHTLGFYDIPSICKKLKKESTKKMQKIIEEIKDRGYSASRTHLSPQGIRSDIPQEEFIEII